MSQPIAFEGRSPEELQAKVRQALSADIEDLTIVRHGKERYGGLFGFFQRERWLLEVEVPDALGEPTGPVAVIPPSTSAAAPAGSTRLDQLLEGSDDLVVDFGQTFAEVLADAEATVAVPAQESPAGRLFSVTEPEPTPLALDPARLTEAPAGLRSGLVARAALIAAGLPDRLLPDAADIRPDMALLLRLLQLPEPPRQPVAAGDVLVLAGPLEGILELGPQLATAAGGPKALVVASHRALPSDVPEAARATTSEAAALAIFARRAKGAVTVVALDSQCRAPFVRSVVAGLRPEACWGVVPAGWSVDQVKTLAGRLGRMDALALHGMLATDRPARLVGGPWPLTHVDGWVANPLAVTARLVDAVTRVTAAGEELECEDD